MYTLHPVFRDPEGDNIFLWRYMDFPKFYSLLRTSCLFFPSAYVLLNSDPFEGSLPRKEYELMLTRMDKEGLIRAHNHLRKNMFISCWHYNNTESLAMWQLYSHKGSGIAIKTTLPAFKQAVNAYDVNIYIGKVIYVDYQTEVFYEGERNPYTVMNTFEYFVHKRDIFRHEQELRAIVNDEEAAKSDLPGKLILVLLEDLIKEVILAPETPKWILDIVNILLRESDLDIEARFSSFHDEPFV